MKTEVNTDIEKIYSVIDQNIELAKALLGQANKLDALLFNEQPVDKMELMNELKALRKNIDLLLISTDSLITISKNLRAFFQKLN